MVHHYLQRTIKWCSFTYSAPLNGAPLYIYSAPFNGAPLYIVHHYFFLALLRHQARRGPPLELLREARAIMTRGSRALALWAGPAAQPLLSPEQVPGELRPRSLYIAHH